jgi:hypothetical protein
MFKDKSYQAVEAHKVVRLQAFHIILDNRLTNVGNVFSLMRRQPLTPRKIPVRDWVVPKAIVQLEGLGKLEKR